MEPEVIGTIGVLANKSRTAVLKILGFQGDKVNIIGEYHTAEGSIQQYSNVAVTSSKMKDSPVYDSLVDKGYTYYTEVIVPAPGRYQVINQTYGVGNTTYSAIPTDRNPLPIGNSTASGVSWNYRGEFVDVRMCTYNVVDARLNVMRWGGIKAIVNAHKEKEYLHLGQIVEAPAGLNSITGGSAQFAVYSIDDVPCYPHAVIFGPVGPLLGPKMMTEVTKGSVNNNYGYYETTIGVTLDTTYFSSLPSELQNMITPRQATYTPGGSGNNAKSYYPETHRVWLPRLSEMITQANNRENLGSGELTKSGSYLELDARPFGLGKYCEYHPNTSTLLNDIESSNRIYYRYSIWTATCQVGTGFTYITAGGKILFAAPNVNQTKTPIYVTPFFMIAADDDSCEYHHLRMLT